MALLAPEFYANVVVYVWLHFIKSYWWSIWLTIANNSDILWVMTVEISVHFIFTVNQPTLITPTINFMYVNRKITPSSKTEEMKQ